MFCMFRLRCLNIWMIAEVLPCYILSGTSWLSSMHTWWILIPILNGCCLFMLCRDFDAYFDLLLAYHLILHWQYSFSLTSFLLNFGQSSWMQTVLSLAHFVDLISSWIWSLTTQLRSMETKRMTSGWWSSGETVLSWLKHSNQLPRLSELSDLDMVQPLS